MRRSRSRKGVNLVGTLYAANAKLIITGNGQVTGHGDPIHVIGSQLILSDLDLAGNGRFHVDASYNQSLTLSETISPAPVRLPDGTFVTSVAQSTIAGVTKPGAYVSLETGNDAQFDDGVVTADTSGRYSFSVDLKPGSNLLQ